MDVELKGLEGMGGKRMMGKGLVEGDVEGGVKGGKI